jgi:hypothetical protein
VPQSGKAGSSPYATGGGGVRLEQEFAGSALASLLLGQPVEGLGDDFTPTQVAMQQEAQSPVDDVIIDGVSPGAERTLRVACRRRPMLSKSKDSTIKLFADFLQVVLRDQGAIAAGQVRLGLAVARSSESTGELATLTEVARRQPSRASFQAAINAASAHSSKVRSRLKSVDWIVEAALGHLGLENETKQSADELSWYLLRGLFVIDLQLEGDVAPGRTNVVARLRALTGDVSRAEDLRLRLVEIASQSAICAGGLTQAMVRRELRSFGLLGASPGFGSVRSQISLLELELQHRTQRSLPVPGATIFTLDRSHRQSELVELISTAPPGSAVLVHGEPDVGKSALTLAAIDAIRASGGVALAISLRDLPSAAVNLKAALGLGPTDLFAAAPSAPVSALVLDGAEVVQEGESGALGALLNAATAVGMTTVLVVRDDAAGAVRELLKIRGVDKPLEFDVGPLSAAEIAVLVQAIPELARLTSDPRAVWLLRRIGLVELLLKAAQGGGGLPETLSSEAEIFATVWSILIRQNEGIVGGVSPDDRESAIIDVARQLLIGTPNQTTAGAALASLRSDGILLSQGRSAVWEAGDRFVSDVLRDFATARLLIRNGLETIVTSAAPRWAIRATRLFAQARLAQAAECGGSIAERWAQLRAEFAELAARHGARWAELPWEALLTAGWADRALSELTPTLLDSAEMRAEAIRTLKLRFSQAGACDPVISAPMVSWLVDTAGMLDRPRSYRDDPILQLVLSWLRGIARLEVACHDVTPYRPLRSRIRDVLMLREIERGEKERLESLGLLGTDSNKASVAALGTIAQRAPGFLAPVVENLDVAMLLSKQNPGLLADLAEAYYLKQPSENPWDDSLEDEGIREHEGGGFGMPSAAWYRGPFLPLLQQDFPRGLALINRMLDRGCRGRVNILCNLELNLCESMPEKLVEEGVHLDLLGAGSRVFVGDSHAWSWYRGSSVGPYPCMSALLSLEMFLDELVRSNVSPRTIITGLLRDATNLATAGLVYGFFVRHIEKISDELDGFLAVPDIWKLEFDRVTSEGLLHVQGPDAPELPGRDRRRWNPYEVATWLVLTAAQRGDDEAVKRLLAVGHRLIEAAGGETAPPYVRQWAAYLDWDSYSLSTQDGHRVLALEIPENVAQALAQAQTRSAIVEEMYRLRNRYKPRFVTPYRAALATPEGTELADDFCAARKLETELLEEPLDLLRALSGVAAAVFQNAVNGLSVPDLSIEWAFPLLVDCATLPYRARFSKQAFFDGPDRQAALALPLALVHTDDEQLSAGPSRDATEALIALSMAVTAGTSSPAVEVRQNAAEGLRVVSGQPCGRMADGCCWHELLWQAIEAGARSVARGAPSENGRRQIEPIIGDVVVALAERPARDLSLTHIAPAAICALDAAQGETCIKARAERLRDGLLDAYARAACHWAEKHYRWRDEQHASFASAVLRWTEAADQPVVVELAERLRSSLDAQADYLHALIIVATYETHVVPSLVGVWPQLMELGLAHIRNALSTSRRPHPDEKLLRNLIPSPSVFGYLDDMDAVLAKASANWFPLIAISGHIDEWLERARGQMTCVDALVGFLQAQPVQEQVARGLDWICRLVVSDDGTALTSGFLLMSWLARLRDSPILRLESKPTYRTLVDALVLSNSAGARELQRRDE